MRTSIGTALARGRLAGRALRVLASVVSSVPQGARLVAATRAYEIAIARASEMLEASGDDVAAEELAALEDAVRIAGVALESLIALVGLAVSSSKPDS